MKRDMDLVRSILLEMEAVERGWLDAKALAERLDLPGQEGVLRVAAHLEIMGEAGLIDFAPMTMSQSPTAVGGNALRILWDGHDFLDAVRDDSTWAKVKERAGKKVGSVSFDVLKALAIAVAKEALGL